MAPISKLGKSSMDTLQRTKSDISTVLLHTMDENISDHDPVSLTTTTLPILSEISEVELAKCECCGMSEECSAEYMEEMKKRYSGKLICGLCGEAVKEEMEKNGGRTREEALEEHMSACVRFNRLGRVYPALYQADAVKKLLKKSSSAVSKSGNNNRKGGLARSSSCIPAINKDIKDKLRF